MPLWRPFDDGRFPDIDGKADCFLCGKRCDPRAPLNTAAERLTYEIRGATTPLPMHRGCMDGKDTFQVHCAFLAAYNEMIEHPRPEEAGV